jgi:amino acid transporter
MTDQDMHSGAPRDVEAQFLERLGHKQRLQRVMGIYSSFALAICVLTITVTLFTLYSAGFQSIGGVAVWLWVPVILFGVLLTYVWGQLAAAIPLSGVSYQWTARLVGPKYGFTAGWTQVVAWYLGTAAIAVSAGTVFTPVMFTHPTTTEIELTATIAVVIATIANIVHIRVAAVVNNIGTFIELTLTIALGLAIAIGLAFFHSHQPASFLFSTTPVGGGKVSFDAISAALLLPAFVILGWDAAADLAEESRDTRRIAPRAMTRAVIIGGLITFVLYILLGLAIPGDPAKFFALPGNPLLNVVQTRFGSAMTYLVEVAVGWAFMSAIIANIAAASRISFGLARDQMLPGSKPWAAIGTRTRTPITAILLAGAIGILFNYLSAGIASRALAIVAVAGYGVYAFIAAAVVYAGIRGRIPVPEPGFLNLGRWMMPAAAVGFGWCILVVLFLVLPASGHLGAIYFLYAEALGVLWLAFGVVPRLRRGTAGPPAEDVAAKVAAQRPGPSVPGASGEMRA